MTDKLILTDGTSAGLAAAGAFSDSDGIEVQQTTAAPASTSGGTLAQLWTWILSKIAANSDTVRSNAQLGFGSLRNRFYTFTDCLSGVQENGWGFSTSGTGAGVNATSIGSLNALGILQLDLGTTTTGRAAITANALSAPSVLLFGLGRARFASKCAVSTLSNGTDTFQARVGFLDGVTGSDPVDGVYFRYSDSINGGKWQAVTRSNNTESVADTGISVAAGTWRLLSIDVNAAGTSAAFSIDGSVVATITTNIPNANGRDTGYGVAAIKSAGTTATAAMQVDYAEVEVNFTSAR